MLAQHLGDIVFHATTEEGRPVTVNLHPMSQLMFGVLITMMGGIGVWMTQTLVDLNTRTTALEATYSVESSRGYITVREFEQANRTQEAALSRLEFKIDQLQQHLMDSGTQ